MPPLKSLFDCKGQRGHVRFLWHVLGDNLAICSDSALVRDQYLGNDFVVVGIMRATVAARIDSRPVQILLEKPSHPSPSSAVDAQFPLQIL